MTIVYQGGPYGGQDDYLLPPPNRLRAVGGQGFYQRTRQRDGLGRLVYEWVARPAVGERTSTHASSSAS
jgi:hypothetical protein